MKTKEQLREQIIDLVISSIMPNGTDGGTISDEECINEIDKLLRENVSEIKKENKKLSEHNKELLGLIDEYESFYPH